MNTRGIVTFLIGLGLVILVIILFVKAFTGGSDRVVEEPTKLTSYADTATVLQMTAEGPINADRDHQAVRITVGIDEVTIQILSGYNGAVVAERSFANTQAAYDQFLHALENAGYNNGGAPEGAPTEKGQCPTGSRYVYEIIDGNRSIDRLWSASCSKLGTLKGKRATILTIFRNQIPRADYNDLTRGLNISSI